MKLRTLLERWVTAMERFDDAHISEIFAWNALVRRYHQATPAEVDGAGLPAALPSMIEMRSWSAVKRRKAVRKVRGG
jgi:hypothetical protein